MAKGYTGKLLWVDLATGQMKTEKPKLAFYRDYIGGYGIGARVLYDRMRSKVDPLGPDNILGFITGPLTGTQIPAGARYVVVAKSPLTGGWGDANCGGYFGPYLKFTGYDGIFFSGISPKPIYLMIDEGKAELRDASKLWGKDTYETEAALERDCGKESRVACIGPAGEMMSLISCIITDHGSAAGRSGLGAVMGSKKLKAVVVKGSRTVQVADQEMIDRLRKEHITELSAPGPMNMKALHRFGTSALTANSAHSGDTPVRNWGGVGVVDLPDVNGLKAEVLETYVAKLSGCWRCPIACKATLKAGNEYSYAAGVRRPEYETQASFGANCGNSHTESINKANDICNRYGIDTISAGTVIAFAIECYENGIITKKDTGGVELKWGDHRALVDMTEKMARREGIGAILADGVKVAAKRIGRGAEKYAVHVGGQEVGMHDPKLGGGFSSGARYQMDATPGRHTQGFGPDGLTGHVVNASGMCLIGFGFGTGPDRIKDFINAVTGANYSVKAILRAGERIGALRHAFNLREGVNELNWIPHPRITGELPQKEGPLAGVTIDQKAQVYWNMGTLGWDPKTTKPGKNKLLELGLEDVAHDLWQD